MPKKIAENLVQLTFRTVQRAFLVVVSVQLLQATENSRKQAENKIVASLELHFCGVQHLWFHTLYKFKTAAATAHSAPQHSGLNNLNDMTLEYSFDLRKVLL